METVADVHRIYKQGLYLLNGIADPFTVNFKESGH